MDKTEFYTFENEVWYRTSDGKNERLTDECRDIIKGMLSNIEFFYPKAYKALSEEYSKCRLNLSYYQYRIVNRFCKCNFGNIDNVPDVDTFGRYNFERVPCPLRGECRYDNIICSPEFESNITASEMRVMRLVYIGESTEKIADKLCLSIFTVRNHIRNVFTRLGIHEKSEFIRYANDNKLFKDEEF